MVYIMPETVFCFTEYKTLWTHTNCSGWLERGSQWT